MNMLEGTNPNLPNWSAQPVVFLCDYTEDNLCKITWDTTNPIEIDKELLYSTAVDANQILVNLDKEEYVDILKLIKLHRKQGKTDWLIHPLSFLVNSESVSMGGGDFRGDQQPLCRMAWTGDRISVVRDFSTISNFTDVTKQCIIIE